MPVSDEQKEFVERMQREYQENPPSKVKGCLATLGIMTLMFGLPALMTYGGIGLDSIFGEILVILIIVGVNLIIYKIRKNLKYKQKRFYHLTEKNKEELTSLPNLCRKCHQILTPEMIFCPKCSAHVHEDLPVDLRKMTRPVKPQAKSAPSPIVEAMSDEPAPSIETPMSKNGQKFCTNCGNPVEGKKFCPECGTKTEVM
jgi:RNA polymerase subunit RPABC4/transcription elongation factor Spt4